MQPAPRWSHRKAAASCSWYHPLWAAIWIAVSQLLQSALFHKGSLSWFNWNQGHLEMRSTPKSKKDLPYIFHSIPPAWQLIGLHTEIWLTFLFDCSCHLHLPSPPASHTEACLKTCFAIPEMETPSCTQICVSPTDSQNKNFGSLPPPPWKAATVISKVTYSSIEGSCMPILKNNCVPIRERILSGVNMHFLSLWKKRLISSLLIHFQKLIIFFHIIILTSKEITLNYVYRDGGYAERPKYDSLRGVALYISMNCF